jgi:serine/threonine-protein kinase
MSLVAASRLGPYEVLGPLGAGAMGEVWRARDTRLEREVALKLLPDSLASDPDRMARFEREAKLLASLNHPHIAAVHGLEESGAIRALVMELVEGPTLAARLTQGPMPLAEVLALARQIAEAVAHAHEHGIVHRDLKPANIKITPAGDVKVLDFGLAKALTGDIEAGADLVSSPTRTRRGTEAGIVLGTAPYMAPEQARGKAVDRRADVWAFGVVLFEMLTGTGLFQGETTSDVLASVLKSEIDWTRLPAGTPTPIRRLLRRCLERDPRQRLHDLGDARLELEEALREPEAGEATPAEPAAVRPGRWRRLLPWAVAFGAAAMAASLFVGRRAPPAPRRVTRLALRLVPPPLTVGGFALAPDGSRLAYVARGQIHTRALDREDVRALPDARGERPFFSPDGDWIAFVGSDGLLTKVAASGGPPQKLTDRPLGLGQCTWGGDETILCTQPDSERPGVLLAIPGRGGTAHAVPTAEAAARQAVRWPHALPGGRAVLLTVTGASGVLAADAAIAVQHLDTGERRELVRGGAEAVYAPTGHIVYVGSGSLLAVPFELETLSLRGVPLPVVAHVSADTVGGGRFALAQDGTLVYRREVGRARPLLSVDRRGAAVRIPAPDHTFIDPRVSPDGSRIAVQTSDAGSDIWICDLARGTLTRLSFDPQEDETPVWSPDGAWVAWVAQRAGQRRQVLRRRGDGSGEEQLVWSSSAHVHVHDWSPDGRSLLVTQDAAATARDLWLVPVGGGEARELLAEPFEEWNPRFSPDGRWLAYASNESGPFEIYLRRFPELDRKTQVSVGGGDGPVWTVGGRELVYRSADGHVVSVRFSMGPAGVPQVGRPEALFADVYGAAVGRMSHPDYDAFPDGSRFVMLGSQQDEGIGELSVVLNWFEELGGLATAQ